MASSEILEEAAEEDAQEPGGTLCAVLSVRLWCGPAEERLLVERGQQRVQQRVCDRELVFQ